MLDNTDVLIVEDDSNTLVVIQDKLPDAGETVIQDRILDDGGETVIQDVVPDSDSANLYEENVLIIQDGDNPQPSVIEVMTVEQIQTLVDAGPVFRGPIGKTGPEGPSLYDLWTRAGHIGSLDDFFETFRGAQGKPGPIGTPPTYTFVQSDLTCIWNIEHNLNKIPDVILIDSAGDQFDAGIKYPDLNHVVVTTIAPTLGIAFLQ